MLVYLLLECLKIILYLVLLFTAFILVLKLWLEPVKGVCRCKTKLDDRVALVTGGNSGIGLETARDLARRGAKVVIACRNKERSEKAVADIIKTTGNKKVEYRILDLSKFKSIKEFADDFNKQFDRLDLLVNNAGAGGMKHKLTEHGIELTMQVNYFGPFLLTNLLLDKIIASKPSRIVIVSSYANQLHNFDPDDLVGKKQLRFFSKWYRYANTKLCNILWAKALAKRLPDGVTVNALHPGVVKTDIFHRLSRRSKAIILGIIGALFKTPEEGSQTSIHVCVAPELDKVSGEYFSDCIISTAHKMTNDNDLVEKIWEETMFLVKDK